MASPVFLTVMTAACLSGKHTATYLSKDITTRVRGEMLLVGTPITLRKPHTG
ncbi:unnamed protein product [Tetraodon nigroviridis]|uniref:(spotted green pufferfish) hypothetical protein n=1 Tax=Tetraodon nigroviridis TaxID=99883 RepID=Q4T068_TETNG|nr:unnamed protein product [Tetraodon nigroviridis]